MSHQYHRNGMRPLAAQKPHPSRTGFTTTNMVIVSEEKTTEFQQRWEREYRVGWVEVDGKFYPRGSVPGAKP